MANFIDRAVTALLQRPYIKARLVPQAPPAYMRAEVNPAVGEFDLDSYLGGLDEITLQKVAMSVSWIYADLDLLAKKTTSAPLMVKKLSGEKTVDVTNHPFELLWKKPNEFMSRSYLIRYIVMWLSLSKKGAFLYLSPEKGKLDNILEIWPIDSDRITPVKDRLNYVNWFLYTPPSGKPLKINPKYVVWFRYADPFDYWGSSPPLRAILDIMAIEIGINASQKKFYTEGRGMPLSVVSVDPEIGEPDYEQFRHDLKRDWEESGTTLAIARGGTLDVKALGFSQKDLEILGSQELTRDKIGTVLLGLAFRNPEFQSGDGLKQADRFINDNQIHPLHMLIAEQLTIQAINRFWGDEFEVMFEDVRATDRSILIQERNVYSRWKTVNEMRNEEGMDPLPDDEFGFGDTLISLATNPGFAGQMMGLNEQADPSKVEKEQKVGNITGSQDEVAMTNQLARGDSRAESKSTMELEAIRTEIKRWRTVAKRSFREYGSPLARTFTSTIIPPDTMAEITKALNMANSEDTIGMGFDPFVKQFMVNYE